MKEINHYSSGQLETGFIWKCFLLKGRVWKTLHGFFLLFLSFTFNFFFPCRLKLTPHPKGATQAINLNDVPDSSVDQ